jgi:hypothetical protein
VRVVLAHVRRHLHAGEDDPGRGIFGAHAVDDALETGAGDGRLDAAQAVVAAEREDEDVHGLPQGSSRRGAGRRRWSRR